MALKAKYDPINFLAGNQNLKPATTVAAPGWGVWSMIRRSTRAGGIRYVCFGSSADINDLFSASSISDWQ